MIRLYDQNIWGNMPAHARIANRNRLIASLIQKYQPDFCAFQECNPTTSRVGADAMPHLLKDIYAEACPENASRNFTPVFYKKDTFSLIASDFVPYDGLNDLFSKSLTWAVLEEKSSGKQVCIISTHFWWKYDSEEDNAQRLENVRQLERVCRQIRETYQVPILVTGDLNNGAGSLQGDMPYRAMLQCGFTDVRSIAAETTDLPTCKDTYPTLNADGNYVDGIMPEYTIDYILTYGEPQLQALAFRVLTCQDALNSSDHCPLIGDFEF